MKISTRYIRVGRHKVRYQIVGKGDPLILVHGLSGSTLWWTRNVDNLAQHYRVYLVDLPGFGSMHFPRSRFDLKEAGAWLLRWMKAIGLKRAHFIGHSMGGYICLWIAAHHPEAVDRLILIAPAISLKTQSLLRYVVPLTAAIRYTRPLFFFILSYDALRAGPLTLLRAARELLSRDVRAEMAMVTAPTLLVWGENDTLVPPVLAHVAHAEIKNARLIILRNAAHVCMFDQPAAFNAAIEAFLHGETVGE